MAISASNLATTGDSVDRTSYATGSITPTANKLILAWVYSIAAAAPNTPTATGNGLTWVAIDNQIDNANLRKITLFRAMGSSPSSGAVTFDFAGQTQTGAGWSIVQYTDMDTTGTNGSGAIVQSAKAQSVGSTTSLTVTLAAFGSTGNATVGGFGIPLNTAGQPAVGSGFTATGQVNQSTPNLSIGSEFNSGNDTTVDMNAGAASIPWVGIAVEVKASISFDVAGNSGDQAAASSYSGSASWNGVNRALAIDVSMLGAGVTVTAMTYGGANCTFIGAQSTVTSFGRIEQWRIIQSDSGAPAAGANTLSVTLSGSLEFVVEWVSYTGVHQTTPTEAFNSAQATNVGSATDASVSITSIASGCWVHAGVVANDTSITAGNTTRNNISGTLGSGGNEDNGIALNPAGALAMSYTGMGITTTWAIAGYALRPISASAGTITVAPSHMMFGMGA